MLTEVCGKVLSEKNDYKSALLLSNVIDAEHQKQLFVYRPLWVLIGVLANFMNNILLIALTRLLEYISTINSV